MSQVLLPTVETPFREPSSHRKRWTRTECDFLVRNGLLTGPYELIEGDVIPKMGQKPPYAFGVVRLTAYLLSVFGGDYVRFQLPLDVADTDNEVNEPEPDGIALNRPATDFLDRNPGPADVLLLVEISDATLSFDRNTKAHVYSRAGITDYWILDINNRRLLVHRDPTPEGYAEITAFTENERVTPLAAPSAVLTISDMLPPAT
jgi:Uma2 family endonuclease